MRQEAYKKSHEMLVRLFSSPGFHHPAVLQGRRRLFADGHNPHISVRAELEILGGFIVRLAVRQIFFDLIKRNHICNGCCLIEEAAVLIQLIHEELVHIALSVADGSMKYDELLQWVRDHE